MATTTVIQTEQLPLGAALPPFTAHAISVSLPTWKDNVGYEEGEKRVVDAMVSGYPRFFIHLSIQKVRTHHNPPNLSRVASVPRIAILVLRFWVDPESRFCRGMSEWAQF